MIQGSEEWVNWRKKGIGSSDAPIIMGVSPWTTPEELFKEKTGLTKKKKSMNPAMQRGLDLEPAARAYYELKSELEFQAINFEHEKLPFLRASLDGYNHANKIILEIKCPSRADHLLAIQGGIPEKYVYQLQHQFIVTQANRADYFSFDGRRGVVVHAYPNAEIIAELLQKEVLFYECMESKVWKPELFPIRGKTK